MTECQPKKAGTPHTITVVTLRLQKARTPHKSVGHLSYFFGRLLANFCHTEALFFLLSKIAGVLMR